MNQEMRINQTQKMSPELSYKIMQMGELIFELEEEYMHTFSRRVQEKVKQVSQLLRELSEEMEDRHSERMLNWKKFRKDVLKKTQQGFM